MSDKSSVLLFPYRHRFLLYLIITISIFLFIFSSIFIFNFTTTTTTTTTTSKLFNNINITSSSSDFLKPQLDKIKTTPWHNHNHITCDSTNAQLRVYMYDLPPEFHFGLLGWKANGNQTWPTLNSIPPHPGGLNLQHSVEYWLTLHLLSSNTPNIYNINAPCTAIRVHNSTQADVIFVPFFSSLSYNRHSKLHLDAKLSVNSFLQIKLLQFLTNRDEWKKMGGKDHLIMAHHPNSMLDARNKLGSAMFLLADFGRYPLQVANINKDIIAPYKHVVKTILPHQSATFDQRHTLAFFQGAIYRKDRGIIRQELYYMLKDEKDVHFTFGTIIGNGVKEAGHGMAMSKFCLNIAGDTPSSNRLFDAIASHCVPVIISDEIELPFEDALDYSEFCIFVRSSDAVKKGYLLNLLRGVGRERWTKMWEKLKKIVPHMEYRYPSIPGDAVDMIWQTVSHKIASIQYKLHKKNRYHRSQLLLNSN
ncbi:hypothetical protein ACFE04_025282 [Oxalis oulophora]